MCGIVGYIGEQGCKDILLNGLEKLEYRGYDSAGIALLTENGVNIFKDKGRIAHLRSICDESTDSTIGIGHTRWATHGKPNLVNSHPHESTSGRFTLVHNGVIENDDQLKENTLSKVAFKSDTDTEVIVQLIEKHVFEGNSVEEAFRLALQDLQGSYALALLDEEDMNTIYVAKNKSPLLVGVNEDFHCVASDAMAMLQVTNQYVELHDKEYVILKKDSYTIKDLSGEQKTREPYTALIDSSDIEKGTYPHFMLKEIDEQPVVTRKIIQEYRTTNGEINISEDIIKELANADRLYIVACGTSYYAGLVGKQLFERVSNLPVEVHIASEFSYNLPLLSERPVFLYITQSGETADSRACLVKTNELGLPSITLTNVMGSTLSREAKHTLLLHAGPEIAVASTKAYTAQVSVLSILAVAVASQKGRTVDFDIFKELAIAANAMETLCDQKEDMEKIATEYLAETRNCFFIGRGVDYYLCLEAALKLKELSYVQAEGFPGGELKHGTIALIEQDTPVIAIATQKHVALNIRGNAKEVAARGANVCVIAMDGLQTEGDRFVLPKVNEYITPLVSVIPLQLIAYYTALHRGCDVDKPRNLAKSVTVE